jgi:hypothetical protein
LSIVLFVFNKQNNLNKTFVHPVSHLIGANLGERDALLASTALVAAAAGKAEGGGWVGDWNFGIPLHSRDHRSLSYSAVLSPVHFPSLSFSSCPARTNIQ